MNSEHTLVKAKIKQITKDGGIMINTLDEKTLNVNMLNDVIFLFIEFNLN